MGRRKTLSLFYPKKYRKKECCAILWAYVHPENSFISYIIHHMNLTQRKMCKRNMIVVMWKYPAAAAIKDNTWQQPSWPTDHLRGEEVTANARRLWRKRSHSEQSMPSNFRKLNHFYFGKVHWNRTGEYRGMQTTTLAHVDDESFECDLSTGEVKPLFLVQIFGCAGHPFS